MAFNFATLQSGASSSAPRALLYSLIAERTHSEPESCAHLVSCAPTRGYDATIFFGTLTPTEKNSHSKK